MHTAMRRAGRIALLSLVLAWTAFAQDGNEPITVTDLLRIRQLESPTVSPDGRWLAYIVRQIDTVETEPDVRYAYRTHLYLVPTDGSTPPRAYTHGDRTASQPAWHPESDRIAFVRPVGGKPQLFVISLFGGEAEQLTDFRHGASRPRWRPDGSLLLFTATLSEKDVRRAEGTPPWPDERPARTASDTAGARPNPDGSLAEIRAWLARNEADSNPRVFHRLDFQGEQSLQPQLRFQHLYVVEPRPGAKPRALTHGFFSFSGAEWLPHGRQIVAAALLDSTRHPDRTRGSDLYLIDVDTSRINLLLHIDGYALFAPTPSPDGQWIAFLASPLADSGYAQTEIGLFRLDGRRPPELLTLHFDRSAGNLKWAPDMRYLYFVAPSNGGFPLYRIPFFDLHPPRPAGATAPDTTASRARFTADEVVRLRPKIERLLDYDRGVRDYDLSEATVYYVLTEPTNPYELYASDLAFKRPHRLTEHNASWLRTKRLSRPEAFTLKRDTLEIQYWVMKPAFFEKGRRYPMLLEIHGGPAAMWGPGEATMWHEFQFFASQGFAVVFSNPRGSGGYGRAFRRANYQDWGDGPAGDVLAVASAAARLPWIDPERQVVTGGSYAGYLTAWIVAHDHRFKAAVAQRGVYDLQTFLGEGNAWRLVPWHFGGYPWDRETPALLHGDTASVRDVILYNSPITWVHQIRTPLLIMHSDRDLRTGVIQSEMLYKSLKILGRPVEYVRYPDEGHELSRSGDPKRRMDRILRIYEFFMRYLPAETPPASE
ncbi:peptidase S9 prolyl oligopeptidase active site domain protein [Rhodothermus marinus SG0.5JP17-172]|uniref:S9 family peptidase n=1 Tax=Rhodothermus marinus TaxID=29549 RepID=UPI000223DE45|nr:S9 family peptidase [Rhodothermus marinus]AEN74471.1 peptidase S9 prolyl oligopeptidase active site domain protein [Rhodothermus marinus SG0.5JP17-172]MBO2493137.1 S9 family peptidase [Rhodothermus marinus]